MTQKTQAGMPGACEKSGERRDSAAIASELMQHAHDAQVLKLQEANAQLVISNFVAQNISDERYRTLFDSIDDGFCIIEKIGDGHSVPLDFRFIEANPAVAVQSGISDVLGKTIREVIPHDADDWLPTYDAVLTTGQPIMFERELVSQERILELYAFRIKDGLHQRVGISFKDITERKRAEALLRSNHDTFFRLVQNAPFGLYVVDTQFRLSQVSTASKKVFENVRPLIGRDFAEVLRLIWAEPFASEAIGRFRHTLETGEPYSAPNTTELRNDIPDVESYDWKIERITLPDGGFGVVCYFYDITQRKKTEDALRESEAFNRSIIDSSPDCIKVLDLEGNLLSILSGQALLGIDDIQPYLNTSWLDFWEEPEHREAAQRAVKTGAYEQGNFVGFFRTPHGEPKWWDVSVSPILDANRQPVRLLAVSRDVTHRKHAEDALRESEQRYRTLFNEMDEGFCIIEMLFDAHDNPVDYRFLEMNPAFEKHTGLHEAAGRRMRELASDHEAHWFETYGRIALSGQPVRFVNEAKALNRWFDVYAFRVGEPQHRKVAVLFNNITERKQADIALRDSLNELRATETQLRRTQVALFEEKAALAEHVLQLQEMNESLNRATVEARTLAKEIEKGRSRMAHLAQHDPLTDLPNRILLEDRLAQAISLAHRHDKQFALMFLDLDRFKEINDSLGHAVGDQLLQSVAQRLTAVVRSSDTVCRLGGDEFIILLAEIEHARDAQFSAENILTALMATHRIDQFELQVTVSIGISFYPQHGQNMESLVKNADAAMYQAKAFGRNNYQFFGDM